MPSTAAVLVCLSGLAVLAAASDTPEDVTSVPKLQFEAAFQGKCDSDSPCEHVCFELHDGMFECDCRMGYLLHPNGYSCQELNTTSEPSIELEISSQVLPEDADKDAEDILYSRDASFSAHLDPGNDLAASTPQPEAADESSTQPERVRFVPPSTTTATPQCLLECGVGLCLDVAAPNGRRQQRCQCPLGRTGTHCEIDTLEAPRIARFSGQSFLAFPALRGAYKDVQVTLEFKPETTDGVLLLAAERDDMAGDFLALVLVDSFLEFRFDCGSGEGGVRSPEPVLLNQWNKLTLYRHRWDAWLQLNGGKHVQGRSKGLFSRITFREPLFVGGPGNTTGLAAKLGASEGFRGCIRHLELNDHVYGFGLAPLGDASQGFDIEECSSDACSRLTCQHGGKCVSTGEIIATSSLGATAVDASCLCPLGYTGTYCEQRLELQVPSFNGSSFLRYEGLGSSALSWLEIRLVFKPESADGLLLYNGGRADGVGDFASLALVGGHLEFTFDLGTGPATVRSRTVVSLHSWHEVLVSRTGRSAWLQLDTQPPSHASSPGAFTQLMLAQSLYVGGVPSLEIVSPKAKARSSFVGCIQKLEINSRPIRLLASALSGMNVVNCAHPCSTRPCANGGHCIPDHEFFYCECPKGFKDVHCGTPAGKVEEIAIETTLNEPIPQFTGHSYLHFTDQETIKRIVSNKLNINIRFRTQSSGGLLLWSGRRSESSGGDSLALGVRAGMLELRYNLGSGEVLLVYNFSRVDDGLWHRVKALRNEQEGALIVDNGPMVTQRSPGRLRQLNTDTGLYIGGVEEPSRLPASQSWPGFVGCVSDFTLDGDYHVPLVHGAASGRNIEHCE
ncbi:pikachurin [Neocloeon triangulifer]|uniref:pikachurin n=1 Tax=Neocloeon triangulifer TaxID=2078957 RepID=UPI00286F701E|nr:pikachurin [Neocloeon triangulifer]